MGVISVNFLIQNIVYNNVEHMHNWKIDLCSLDLTIQEVLQDDVVILAELPSLMNLYVHIEGTPKEKVVISGTGFSALEYLKVGCSRASALTFEAGAMPKLQWLKIYFKQNSGASTVVHLPASSTFQASRKSMCASGAPTMILIQELQCPR